MKTNKVIIILIDGMRPDALSACGNLYVKTLLDESAYTLNAQTVKQSITLPCHVSLFQSVPPERHGVYSNIFIPSPRPIDGLCERLRANGKRCGFFYSWGELRDLTHPDSLVYTEFIKYTEADVDDRLTESAIKHIREENLDFAFVYQHGSDFFGHANGWMSKTYLQAVSDAFDNVEKLITEFGEEYTVIVLADHGGHERTHGTELPEDMTIPVIIRGERLKTGKISREVSILDISPTIAELMDIKAAEEWEGKSLL